MPGFYSLRPPRPSCTSSTTVPANFPRAMLYSLIDQVASIFHLGIDCSAYKPRAHGRLPGRDQDLLSKVGIIQLIFLPCGEQVMLGHAVAPTIFLSGRYGGHRRTRLQYGWPKPRQGGSADLPAIAVVLVRYIEMVVF